MRIRQKKEIGVSQIISKNRPKVNEAWEKWLFAISGPDFQQCFAGTAKVFRLNIDIFYCR